jgi:hypothetical protein
MLAELWRKGRNTHISRPILRPYDERFDFEMNYGLFVEVADEDQPKAIK